MATTTAPARPTLIEAAIADAAWLLRWLADFVVALLTHPAAGKHAGTPERRPEFGFDAQFVDELRALNVRLADDRDFGLFCGDLVPPTVEFTLEERLDADSTFGPTLRMLPAAPDATEVAFTAFARREAAVNPA